MLEAAGGLLSPEAAGIITSVLLGSNSKSEGRIEGLHLTFVKTGSLVTTLEDSAFDLGVKDSSLPLEMSMN